MADETIDLTRGIYRRIYANFIAGRRINAVSELAEMWFWRLLSVADDFGNLVGEPCLVYAATAGRRIGSITMDEVTTCVEELVAIGLIDRYSVGEDVYLHIRGYLETQAAGINGKRVRRVPAWPGEGETPPDTRRRVRVNPGESRSARVNPGGNLNYESEPEPKPEPEPDGVAGATPRGAAQTGGKPAASESPPPTPTTSPGTPGMVFACSGTPATWELSRAEIDRLIADKDDVPVEAELRKLRTRAAVDSGARRPARDMPLRIVRWLENAQNNPSLKAKAAAVPEGPVVTGTTKSAHRQAKHDELDASLEGVTSGRGHSESVRQVV